MRHSTWTNPTDHGGHAAYGNTTRREMPDLLSDCQSFEGHSMWATWEHHCYHTNGDCNLHRNDKPIIDHGVYVVYSYDQPIAMYDPVDGTLHLNEHHYSSKTSEHQGMAGAWTGKRTANRNGTWGVKYTIVWPDGIDI